VVLDASRLELNGNHIGGAIEHRSRSDRLLATPATFMSSPFGARRSSWFPRATLGRYDRFMLRVLPLCDECGRRIEARRRSPFHDTMCRRCFAKTWLLTILELVPI
jgi:hypothetical protein